MYLSTSLVQLTGCDNEIYDHDSKQLAFSRNLIFIEIYICMYCIYLCICVYSNCYRYDSESFKTCITIL